MAERGLGEVQDHPPVGGDIYRLFKGNHTWEHGREERIGQGRGTGGRRQMFLKRNIWEERNEQICNSRGRLVGGDIYSIMEE